MFRGAGLRERDAPLLPPGPKDTHSFPWAMVLGVTHRGDKRLTLLLGVLILEGHKSDHMLLRHVGGCKQGLIWRGTWSILGQGSRHPDPRAVSGDQGSWAAARTMCHTPRAGR